MREGGRMGARGRGREGGVGRGGGEKSGISHGGQGWFRDGEK